MKIHHTYRPRSNTASWLAAMLLLGGCATSGPPTQEMSDARQALDAAHQVDAASHVPETLQDAQSLLSQAEEKLSEGAFEQAQLDALAAKAGATKARTMASAISEAKAALQEADAVGALSGDAMGLLQQAEAAALIDDDETTVRLAREAKRHAERDVNQALLDRTRILLSEAHALMDEVRSLPPGKEAKGNPQHAQQGGIDAVEAAHQRKEGKAAYAAAQHLVDALREAKRRSQLVAVVRPPSVPHVVTSSEPAPDSIGAAHYTVRRGDSLWKIAARHEFYANPHRWPIIYKANRRHIKDTNIIYPGQVLMMPGSDAPRHEK